MASQPLKEDLSRMEGTYGAETVGKMKKMKVFVSGLRGLGIETAKNLVLAGPHSVVLHDDEKVQVADLGANFYLSEKHVGLSRGQSVLEPLKDLNPNVNTSLYSGEITESLLAGFHVVVMCSEASMQDVASINTFCRSQNIVFLYGYLQGATAGVFSDFGNQHHVFDHDGEPCKTLIIDQVLEGQEEGSVTIDGDRHLLGNGDHVKFEEIKGMSDGVTLPPKTYGRDEVIQDINQTHQIKTTKNPKRFLIGNTSNLGKYGGGGIATEVKVPRVAIHRSFQDNLHKPAFNDSYMDFTKFGRNEQLHLAQLAMWRFEQTHHRMPALHSAQDAAGVVEMAKQIATEHTEANKATAHSAMSDYEVDEAVIMKCALYRQAELTALAALFGGVLAQEVIKHTGKYSPISQWFHFDAFELLSDTVPSDAAPVGSRYDHQISVFGKAFQDKLQNQNVFIVGCGALGCEYMKAVAMTGMGTKGKVYVTDDDTIELSNLSRQFLFRRKHVGKGKAVSAAEASLEMNEDLKTSLKVYEVRVEPKSEDVFNDTFWESLDFVVNALDNNQARMYTDQKCVFYNKPLFESGTLGTKANTAVCIPHKTPSYGQGVVAGEDGGIAKCTIRNFPAIILHCIEWAREMFDDWFTVGADTVNAFVEDKKGFLDKAAADNMEEPDTLKRCKEWLDLSGKKNFETCVSIMYDKFVAYFHHGICDLTHAFPKDARTIDKETKADLGAFWHGAKRFPQAIIVDASNNDHAEFIYHGACVLASVFNIQTQTKEQVKAMLQMTNMPTWAPRDVTIDLSEGGDKKAAAGGKTENDGDVVMDDGDIDAEVKALRAYLAEVDVSRLTKLNPADFEKDDDTNHHIDVIRAGCNLRANNYFIKPTTNQHVRMIAGRIIPAIATTTACITGFIQLELYKYVKGVHLDDHRAATINLAMNVFVCENLPDMVKTTTGMDQETYMQVVAIPEGFTCWDMITINKPGLTLGELKEEFAKVHHDAVIDMISCGDKVLYSEAMPSQAAMMQARMAQSVVQVYNDVVGEVYPADRNYMVFDLTVEDAESGDTGVVPQLKYVFK